MAVCTFTFPENDPETAGMNFVTFQCGKAYARPPPKSIPALLKPGTSHSRAEAAVKLHCKRGNAGKLMDGETRGDSRGLACPVEAGNWWWETRTRGPLVGGRAGDEPRE